MSFSHENTVLSSGCGNNGTDFSLIGSSLKNCLTPEAARSIARHFAPNDDGAARWAAGIIQKQLNSAVSLVDVSPDIRARHDFETVGKLENLLTGDDYHGVIVAFCPMGSGKTRHLGKPFAEWTAGKGRFVAIAPLTALVDGLAAEFEADHYQKITKPEVETCDRLAVCMPSIIKEEHSVIHGEADFIFIDEIAGCLSFLKSEHCGKCPKRVFDALVQRIRRAKCVMVADAHINDRVMNFLEHCRPGERFRVIEQPKNPDKRKVEFYKGNDAKVSFVSEILSRVSAGENLWIGAESPDMAKTITSLLQSRGLPVLGIWPGNKGNREQKAFLTAPKAEIGKYRAIVHSPVIQSGVHVADKGKHISRVMWIGQGGKLAAPAVMQTLGRVRYARTFTLALLQNNKQEVYSVDTMQSTILEASGADKVSLYDRFCEFQEQDYQWAVSHAHLAIVAVLRHAGWEVNQIGGVKDDMLGQELTAITEANAERWKQLVLSAPDISSDDAEALRRQQSRTEQENAVLEAHRMRGYLGHVQGMSPDGMWDLWDDGRIVSKIRRFKIQQGKKLSDNDDAALFHRHFPDAQARIYQKLGILGMAPGSRMRKSEWDSAIQNMTQDDWVSAAYLGIVQPSKVLRFHANSKYDVTFQTYTPPEERTFGLFKQVMERMGLEAKNLENRHPAEGEEKYTFTIQPVSFNLMSGIAKLSDGPVNSNICIRDEDLKGTISDDERQTNQSNTGLQDFGLKTGSWQAIDTAAEQRRSNRYSLITIRDKGISVAGIEEPTEPVSRAMFSADVFMAQLEGQGIHPRLMPTARALANEAWCLVKPFIETSHISRSAGEIWLPIANEIGFQVSLNIPIPDFMEGTGESIYPVEYGADIVFPFDIDLSARQIILRRLMKSPLAIRALKANHSPKAAKALLDDLLAA